MKGKGTEKKSLIDLVLDEVDIKEPGTNMKKKLRVMERSPPLLKWLKTMKHQWWIMIRKKTKKSFLFILLYFGEQSKHLLLHLSDVIFFNSWLDETFDKLCDDDFLKL
jgi:hypothetical protein